MLDNHIFGATSKLDTDAMRTKHEKLRFHRELNHQLVIILHFIPLLSKVYAAFTPYNAETRGPQIR